MRVFNSIFIVLFMAMLALPLVFVDLSPDRVSVKENRMLAERPKLADIKSHPGRFIRGFDAWFMDSTGFREQLVGLFKVIDKNIWLNGTIYTDGQYTYLVGKRGHHYFAHVNGMLIPKFQGRQFLSEDQLQSMAGKLEEVKTYLNSKGIPLVVMFCTDKESIYPEYYPKSIKRGTEPIQLDVITRYLQEHTSVDVFNIKQALLVEKDEHLLYNMSSGDLTHYNQIGAFFAYRELMKHITVYFPEMIPYELNDVDILYDESGIPVVSLKTEKIYKKLDSSFFDDVNFTQPFTSQNAAYENTESSLPVVLLLRDSYAAERFIGQYLAQHFGKAVLIHWLNANHFEEYIARYKPDIVVFESAERELRGFADKIAGIPKLP
ncbi:MAG: hypothetical protein FWG29_06885 [Treponema sp.]|nr:hypothetical protein [Treponema sp.]